MIVHTQNRGVEAILIRNKETGGFNRRIYLRLNLRDINRDDKFSYTFESKEIMVEGDSLCLWGVYPAIVCERSKNTSYQSMIKHTALDGSFVEMHFSKDSDGSYETLTKVTGQFKPSKDGCEKKQ